VTLLVKLFGAIRLRQKTVYLNGCAKAQSLSSIFGCETSKMPSGNRPFFQTGKEVTFLVRVKEAIEDPERLLIGV